MICDRCVHKNKPEGGWCYLFKTQPRHECRPPIFRERRIKDISEDWMTEDELVMARHLICEELYDHNTGHSTALTTEQREVLMIRKRRLEDEMTARHMFPLKNH